MNNEQGLDDAITDQLTTLPHFSLGVIPHQVIQHNVTHPLRFS